MLALNLQFSRLDDVIHFLEAANCTAFRQSNGRKIFTLLDFLISFRLFPFSRNPIS
jgi:hypothetical protein